MFVPVNESNYWCEVCGQGDPIVLLHGFTGSTKTWKLLASQLEKDYQVIIIDLPGHGKTCVNEAKTMHECCHDLKSIVEQLGLEKIHLLGYSMGGRTALSFAMIYPNLVKSLVLESASPGLKNKEERSVRVKHDQQLAERIKQTGVEAFVDYWENISLFQSQKKLSDATQQAIRNERLAQNPEGLAMSLYSMGTGSQPSWWSQLSGFTVPTLLVVGQLDSKFIAINKSMQNVLPNSKLIIVENAGHAIHVEQFDFFVKIVSEFILH